MLQFNSRGLASEEDVFCPAGKLFALSLLQTNYRAATSFGTVEIDILKRAIDDAFEGVARPLADLPQVQRRRLRRTGYIRDSIETSSEQDRLSNASCRVADSASAILCESVLESRKDIAQLTIKSRYLCMQPARAASG